jgi:predicted glycogen debranching enzyme
MTSYEGLFLDTDRADEGRHLLLAAGASISEGMLANTADVGGTQYNTVDASPWFLHVVGRHIDRTGDVELGATLAPALRSIVEHYVAGTRFGIRVDPADGLVTQGEPGWALTWMDARVNGEAVTARQGKPVEVNALWVSGLTTFVERSSRAALSSGAVDVAALAARARDSFGKQFDSGRGCFDVIDGPDGDDRSVRPNQLLAAALVPDLVDAGAVVRACAPLMTSVGLRSLDPADDRFLGRHRGDSAARDRAYHQGTVWPWLIGPYVEACRHADVDVSGVIDGLTDHLGDWGLGSVSETLDGDAPHAGTGCPFQAWSVAELLRARRMVQAG